MVENATTATPFPEHGTQYHDGVVEAFLEVPGRTTDFAIRLQLDEHVAPGLQVFVFIDGVYQCNRIVRGLLPPDDPSAAVNYQVDVKMRQMETEIDHGLFLGNRWSVGRLRSGKFESMLLLDSVDSKC